jgi:TetR/AcrR family transcriptional regulator
MLEARKRRSPGKKTRRVRGRPPLDAPEGSQAIREAALSVFARHGFKGASIAMIADRAGVARPLVHYHYASKEALWKAAVSEEFERFREEATAAAARLETVDPARRNDVMALAIVRFVARHPHFGRIATDETRQGSDRGVWLTETYLLPMHELGARLLRKAVGRGRRLPACLRPEHLIPTVFGAINFPYLDAETIERAYGVDVHSEAYIRRQARLVATILGALLESD